MEILDQHLERWPDGTDGPLQVAVTIAMVGGRPEAVGVEIWGVSPDSLRSKDGNGSVARQPTPWTLSPDAPPAAIRSTALRLPLGRIINEAMTTNRAAAQFILSERAPEWATRADVQAKARRVVAATETPVPRRGGRRPLPREHYEQVARVYQESLGNPTRAVMRQFNVSKSQAAKWIYRCRRDPLNLLPPTARGRATGSELTEKSKGRKAR